MPRSYFAHAHRASGVVIETYGPAASHGAALALAVAASPRGMIYITTGYGVDGAAFDIRYVRASQIPDAIQAYLDASKGA